MGTYASNTGVDSAQSRVEIERTLTRYGANNFLYGWDQTTAVVGFRMAGRMIQIKLHLPRRDADSFIFTPERGLKRSAEAQRQAYLGSTMRQGLPGRATAAGAWSRSLVRPPTAYALSASGSPRCASPLAPGLTTTWSFPT
jgi:hypothetical protein